MTKRIARLRADYEAAVEAELSRLTAAGFTNIAKRRRTILRLIEAEVDPDLTKDEVFRERGVVSKGIFYHKDKNWWKDETFRDVYERVRALRQAYESQRLIAEQEDERDEWNRRVREVSQAMLDRALEMLDFPLAEVEIDEDGTTRVTPANWKASDVPAYVNAADRIARLALGMATASTRSELSGPQGKPIDFSVAFGLDNDNGEAHDDEKLAALARAALIAAGARSEEFAREGAHSEGEGVADDGDRHA